MASSERFIYVPLTSYATGVGVFIVHLECLLLKKNFLLYLLPYMVVSCPVLYTVTKAMQL